MKNSFNNLDGEVSGLVEFDSALALSPVKNNPLDAENFYPADGEAYGNDLTGEEGGPFDYASGDPFFSNAGGLFSGTVLDKKERARRRARREARQDERQRRRSERAGSMAEARKTKAGAKLTSAEAQKAAGESLGKESQSDVQLAKALAQTSPKDQKGLSTGAKIGIALGVVAVLGVVGYFVYKKMKAGKGGK